jgi:hypothetical protein
MMRPGTSQRRKKPLNRIRADMFHSLPSAARSREKPQGSTRTASPATAPQKGRRRGARGAQAFRLERYAEDARCREVARDEERGRREDVEQMRFEQHEGERRRELRHPHGHVPTGAVGAVRRAVFIPGGSVFVGVGLRGGCGDVDAMFTRERQAERLDHVTLPREHDGDPQGQRGHEPTSPEVLSKRQHGVLRWRGPWGAVKGLGAFRSFRPESRVRRPAPVRSDPPPFARFAKTSPRAGQDWLICPPVLVAVVRVGHVGVLVAQSLVPMGVGVGLFAGLRVRVLVMFVVDVEVIVRQLRVASGVVGVSRAQEQCHPSGHGRRGPDLGRTKGITEKRHRKQRPREGRRGEVRGLARGAENPQRSQGEHQAEAVAQGTERESLGRDGEGGDGRPEREAQPGESKAPRRGSSTAPRPRDRAG